MREGGTRICALVRQTTDVMSSSQLGPVVTRIGQLVHRHLTRCSWQHRTNKVM